MSVLTSTSGHSSVLFGEPAYLSSGHMILNVFCSASRFLRKNECKRHELGHTGVRPYVCHECPFKTSFVRQDLLKRHMKRTHNIDTGKENRAGEDGVGPSRKKARRD